MCCCQIDVRFSCFSYAMISITYLDKYHKKNKSTKQKRRDLISRGVYTFLSGFEPLAFRLGGKFIPCPAVTLHLFSCSFMSKVSS